METQKQLRIKLASLFVPVLLLVVIFSTTILDAEGTFYRLGYGDGQMFYRWVAGWHHVYYGGYFDPDTNGNPNFTSHDYYYPEIDSAGFNYVWTAVNSPTSDVYHGLHVWHQNDFWVDTLNYYDRGVNYYGGSQCAELEVGNDLITGTYEYFSEPENTNSASWAYDPSPYFRYVFESLPAQHDTGFVINSCIWEPFRGTQNWYVQLIMRIDPAGAGWLDTVITVTFQESDGDCNDGGGRIASPNQELWEQENPNYWSGGGTDSVYSRVFRVFDLLGYINDYDTLNIPFGNCYADMSQHLKLKIYWHDRVKFYLDKVRIMDQPYYYAVETSNTDTINWIHNAANVTMNQNWCYGRCIDEPFPIQYRAIAKVDSIISHGWGKHYVPNLKGKDTTYFHQYYDLVSQVSGAAPPFLMTDTYVLAWNVLTTSDYYTPPSSWYDPFSLQHALDSLMHYSWPPWSHHIPEEQWEFALRPLAELSHRLNVPWIIILQSGEWWNLAPGDTFVQWYRDPSPNEITCEAWMALSFGASGIGYFTVAPGYARVTADTTIIVGNDTLHWHYIRIIPNDSTSTKGYVQSTGIFDFMESDSTFPEEGDFPAVFHTGHFQPNAKYDSIIAFHHNLDIIDSLLLDLDWVYSFSTHQQQSYSYIQSVWTSQDTSASTTFVQVGVFNPPPSADPLDKYFMIVNRRCLDSESRTVHFRLNFGWFNRYRCLGLTDYLLGSQLMKIITTNASGIAEDSLIALAPGHGKLISISGILSPYGPIEPNEEMDWYPDSTHFVTDTLEVKGTLRIHPGTLVKVCDCSAGIIVKPGGHLAILGKPDSLVTIELEENI